MDISLLISRTISLSAKYLCPPITSDLNIFKMRLISCLLYRLFSFFFGLMQMPFRPVVANIFGIMDQFHGRQFFHRWWGVGVGQWGEWFRL